MSDFLSKLKSVFIVEDPNQAKTQASVGNTATKAASKEAASTPSVSQPVYVPTVNATGIANDKFMDVLFKAMEAANIEGFDYFEFKQSLNNLQKVPMDEATRFKSAFAMAQTMGTTADKLISTASHYLGVLQQESNKFGEAATNQINNQIGNKQAQIENFELVIRQKAEQIKKMTEEIDQHRKDLEQLKQDITQSSSKVSQTKADFEASYNMLVSYIQSDINNMKQYLK
jgi:flagellar biosynthesis chaperone FliJ